MYQAHLASAAPPSTPLPPPPNAPLPLLLPHQFYAVERGREIQSPSRAAQEVLSAGRFLHKPKHNCCNLISFSQKNEEICSFFGNRWQMTGDRRPNKQLAVPSRALYLAIRVGRGVGVKNELLEHLTVKLSLHEEQHLAEIITVKKKEIPRQWSERHETPFMSSSCFKLVHGHSVRASPLRWPQFPTKRESVCA